MTAPSLPVDILPRPLHKHVGPRSPPPLRMMAAKGLVPAVAPVDLVRLLWFLGFDEDAAVRDAAVKTCEGLPEKIWSVALRADDLQPEVIDWLADRYAGKDGATHLLLLNAATSDETVARLAPSVPQPLAELIRQNELRLLRHDDIVRGLCRNPAVLASTLDGACDFCVRNGLVLLDVPQLVEAYRRVHGSDPGSAPAEDSAATLMQEFSQELAQEAPEEARAPAVAATPEAEGKKLSMTQRILKMSVSQKIKLATLGNREARQILLRDSNRLVSLAAAQSPRITDGEILTLANSRTANADVLRYIYEKRDYVKNYAIKSALVRNPKVPLPTALKYLPTLQEKDIKELARDRNVPATIQTQAKSWMLKREAASKGPAGGKH